MIDNNTITLEVSQLTASELVEQKSSDNRTMRRLLNNANSVLRSAHAIAQREGSSTDWDSFTKKVVNALTEQNEFFKSKR